MMEKIPDQKHKQAPIGQMLCTPSIRIPTTLLANNSFEDVQSGRLDTCPQAGFSFERKSSDAEQQVTKPTSNSKDAGFFVSLHLRNLPPDAKDPAQQVSQSLQQLLKWAECESNHQQNDITEKNSPVTVSSTCQGVFQTLTTEWICKLAEISKALSCSPPSALEHCLPRQLPDASRFVDFDECLQSIRCGCEVPTQSKRQQKDNGEKEVSEPEAAPTSRTMLTMITNSGFCDPRSLYRLSLTDRIAADRLPGLLRAACRPPTARAAYHLHRAAALLSSMPPPPPHLLPKAQGGALAMEDALPARAPAPSGTAVAAEEKEEAQALAQARARHQAWEWGRGLFMKLMLAQAVAPRKSAELRRLAARLPCAPPVAPAAAARAAAPPAPAPEGLPLRALRGLARATEVERSAYEQEAFRFGGVVQYSCRFRVGARFALRPVRYALSMTFVPWEHEPAEVYLFSLTQLPDDDPLRPEADAGSAAAPLQPLQPCFAVEKVLADDSEEDSDGAAARHLPVAVGAGIGPKQLALLESAAEAAAVAAGLPTEPGEESAGRTLAFLWLALLAAVPLSCEAAAAAGEGGAPFGFAGGLLSRYQRGLQAGLEAAVWAPVHAAMTARARAAALARAAVAEVAVQVERQRQRLGAAEAAAERRQRRRRRRRERKRRREEEEGGGSKKGHRALPHKKSSLTCRQEQLAATRPKKRPRDESANRADVFVPAPIAGCC